MREIRPREVRFHVWPGGYENAEVLLKTDHVMERLREAVERSKSEPEEMSAEDRKEAQIEIRVSVIVADKDWLVRRRYPERRDTPWTEDDA